MRGVVDAVDDPVGAAPGAMAAGQRAEERLPDPVRADSECGLTELQDSCGDVLGQPVRNGPAGGGLEADVVPARWV